MDGWHIPCRTELGWCSLGMSIESGFKSVDAWCVHYILWEVVPRVYHTLLQTTQPTNGGAVTADSSCCANCGEPPRPSNGGSIYRFWACQPCGPAGWLALLLTKAGDVETNPGPVTISMLLYIYLLTKYDEPNLNIKSVH